MPPHLALDLKYFFRPLRGNQSPLPVGFGDLELTVPSRVCSLCNGIRSLVPVFVCTSVYMGTCGALETLAVLTVATVALMWETCHAGHFN